MEIKRTDATDIDPVAKKHLKMMVSATVEQMNFAIKVANHEAMPEFESISARRKTSCGSEELVISVQDGAGQSISGVFLTWQDILSSTSIDDAAGWVAEEIAKRAEDDTGRRR